ncbi:rRNA-binding ribosome biosynthesis protein [Lecanora helva]
MARRRTKKRTHLGAQNGPSKNVPSTRPGPKSMVIRMGAGEIGPSVTQLVKDVRAMMEPNTASRLKERRSNKLRDYTAMAGPLGVSHLLLFSRSATGNTNLRLALTPRGPTMHFKVERYSLSKDVMKAQKHPLGGGKEYLTPPLLVMNHFISQSQPDGAQPAAPKHLESLATEVFQNLVPPISPQSTPLSSIRRVLLLNREIPKAKSSPPTDSSNVSRSEGAFTINLRHFAITTKRTGISRAIRRLDAAEKMLKQRNKRGVPNLGKLEDVADYLLDPAAAAAASGGFTSGSESEVETDAEVEVLERNAKKVLNKKQMAAMRTRNADGETKKRGQPGVEKRAVKLVELGPRMKLRLTKLEEGMCEGKVLWHEFVEKSKEEVDAMETVWTQRREEKARRKEIQKENIERKRRDRKAKAKEGDDDLQKKDDDGVYSEDEWDSEDFNDDLESEVNGEVNGVTVE